MDEQVTSCMRYENLLASRREILLLMILVSVGLYLLIFILTFSLDYIFGYTDSPYFGVPSLFIPENWSVFTIWLIILLLLSFSGPIAYALLRINSINKKVIAFSVPCHQCERAINISAGWACPRCKKVNTPTPRNPRWQERLIFANFQQQEIIEGYHQCSFISQCKHCDNEPAAIRCPNCHSGIQLTKNAPPSEEWWARLVEDEDFDQENANESISEKNDIRKQILKRVGSMVALQDVEMELLDEAERIPDDAKRKRRTKNIRAAIKEFEEKQIP